MFPSRRIATSGGDVFRNEYSLEFDGTDDTVTLGAGTLDFDSDADDFTVSIWAKYDGSDSGTLIARAYDSGGNGGYKIHSGSSNRIFFYVGGTGRYWTESGAGHQDNEWHLFTLVNYDDGGTQKFVGYVDGILRTLDGGTVPATSGSTDVGATYHTRIGARDHGAGSPTGFFTGSIDEVAIWNTALSSSQVKSLYNNREPFNAKNIALSNLKGYWRMGDGVLDHRQTNGLVADQVTPTLGSEVIGDTSFEDASYWSTTTPVSGTIDVNSTNAGKATFIGVSDGNLYKNDIMTPGQLYRLDLVIDTMGVGGDTTARIRFYAAAHQYFTSDSPVAYVSVGINTFYLVANSGGDFGLEFDDTSTCTISDISLKPVTGNGGRMVNFDGTDFKTDTH